MNLVFGFILTSFTLLPFALYTDEVMTQSLADWMIQIVMGAFSVWYLIPGVFLAISQKAYFAWRKSRKNNS